MGRPTDPFESRRRQEAFEARREELSAEEAYKQGVVEASRVPVIFADPDNIREIDLRFSQRPPFHRNPGYSLEQQLNRQVPGAAAAVLSRANEGSTERYSMNQVARVIKEAGPAALSRVMIDGQEYGLVIMPNRRFDSKADMVNDMFDHLDRDTRRAILRNTPGTDAQWMRFIGNHEGEHLNDHTPRTNVTQTLAEEVRADRSARALALARGEGDIALAWRDIRALRAFGDPEHATGPLLASEDRVEWQHYHSADFSLALMNQAVQDNFDWANYAGKARTPQDLLKENPEAYFGIVRQEVQDIEATAMAGYNADPNSLPAQRAVIDAQIRIDYFRDFEDAWRRRVMGQDIPERAPTQLITQEQEDAYFKEAAFQSRVTRERIEVEREAIAAYPDERIFEGVDLSAEGEEIETLDDLWSADPVRYHEIMQERLDTLRDEALAVHAADPSYENLERLMQLEMMIDDNEFGLSFERNRADPTKKPEDMVVPEPVNILTEDQRRAYYQERMDRKDAGTWVAPAPYEPPVAPEPAAEEAAVEAEMHNDSPAPADGGGGPDELASPVSKDYQQGVDGTAYTAVVSGLQPGEPVVEFDAGNRITVGGMTMGGLFAQSADPDPSAISLVNAREPTPEDGIGFVPPQVQAERSAHLGAPA